MPKKPKDDLKLKDISFKDIQSDINALVQDHLIDGKRISWDANSSASSDIDFSVPAPNIIEWSVGKSFLNQPSIYEYKRAYQVLRDMFNLRCPICNPPTRMAADCWDKGREYLESEVLLTWSSTYQDDICPKCGTTRIEFEEDNIFKKYSTFILNIGMRSGKTTLAGAYIGTYVEHRILTLGDPGSYFGLFPGQPFEVAFTATTAEQSKKTSYASYKNARDKSPWIQAYIQRVKNEESKKGLDKNSLYRETESKISYRNINVDFTSLNSNSSGLAGSTRLFAIIDELGRFDAPIEGSKRSGKEVFNVLNNSLMTIRTKVKNNNLPRMFGLMGSVSSPMSQADMLMSLTRQSKKDDSIFCVHMPTWEFNPDITRADLESEFKRDPIGAERDFGANPPMGEKPLITDAERFKTCINPELKPSATFEQTSPVDGMGRAYVGQRLVSSLFDTDNIHFLAGDAGKSKDSFALVSAHGEWQERESDGRKEDTFVTILDWCLTIRPILKPRRTVYFDCIMDIMKQLNQRQKIASVTFDHWNSESIIQSIRNLQIDADVYCTKADDYIRFVSDCYDGKVHLLAPAADDDNRDPYINMSDPGRLIHEMLNLERSDDLKKVDHRQNEHNDLACCIAAVHKYVQESGMKGIKGYSRKNLAESAKQWNTTKMIKFKGWS